MDPEQFFSGCRAAEKKELHGYAVCPPGSRLGASTSADGTSGGGSKTVSVVLNVLLVVVLVLVLVAAWHKRKLRQQKFREMVAKEVAAFASKESGIWEDDVLLKHRLDLAAVTRLQLVAAGMYGEVWLAAYGSDKVALKCLRETDASRELIGNFVEEIKLLSTLAHPKVVRFVGVVWTKESDIAVLTEFMAGGDLRSYLDRTPKQPTDGWDATALRIALDVTEALVYLHSLEPALIHRDLKSRNVLLDGARHAKLSDFGVSRYKLDDDVTMTANVGTVRWVAPEVLAGDRYDESADLFSLGVILSEIDTHALPYADAHSDEGEPLSDSAVATLVLAGALALGFSAGCPAEIRSLASRCTAHDPTQRPTAVQVAFELRSLLLLRAEQQSDPTPALDSGGRVADDGDGGDGSDSAQEEAGSSRSSSSNTIAV